jgi:alpha-tubulin suppressor-like RCC1 family protein
MARQQMCVRAVEGDAHCFRPFPENFHKIWHATPLLKNATKIAFGGAGNGCAIMRDGTVSCWGNADDGQLGDACSDFESSHPSVPQQVVGLHGTDVAAGAAHTCVVADDGSVRCFGCNAHGELGNGTTGSSWKPVAVNGLHDVTNVAATYTGACALRKNGTVACWGLVTVEAGLPPVLVPVDILGLMGATQIAAGNNFVCALTRASVVACWGMDWATHKVHDVPTIVDDLKDVVQLEASVSLACARLAGGTVRCWGDGFGGQLGDGKLTDAETPTEVVGVRDVSEIALGGAAGCALTAKNELWCWGSERPRPPLPEVNGAPADEHPWTPVLVAY